MTQTIGMMMFDKARLESELLKELASSTLGERAAYLKDLYVSCIGLRLAFRSSLMMLSPLDDWFQQAHCFDVRSFASFRERLEAAHVVFLDEADRPEFLADYLASWEALGEAAYEWEHPHGVYEPRVAGAFSHAFDALRGWLNRTGGLTPEDAQAEAVSRLAARVAQYSDVPWEYKLFEPFEEMGLSEANLGRSFLVEIPRIR